MEEIPTHQAFGQSRPPIFQIFNRRQKQPGKPQPEKNAFRFLQQQLFLKFDENGRIRERKRRPTWLNRLEPILHNPQQELQTLPNAIASLR